MATSKPNPFVPSFIRAAMSGSRPLTLTWKDVADTNISSTASFQYDSHQSPLKSSQQLNVDWSQFQNHTFFMSAEAKVNLAFDYIINGFPFDGTRQEVEQFFDNMPGFERWVFNNFPTYRGQLAFSGSRINGEIALTGSAINASDGTYVITQNKTGALFPELSKGTSGQPVLNPTGSTSLTIEMQLYLPRQTNDVQVVCQMMNGEAQGFSFYLEQSVSTTTVTGHFSVVNSASYMTVPVTLTKGTFNHVALQFNRESGLPFLESFLNSEPVAESSTQVEISDMDIHGSNFVIGAGTPILLGSTLVTPIETLSGTIDEFRVFHSARNAKQQAAYAQKPIYATTDLVLYYRFNEPAPPISSGLDDIILDSSGNSLHALISNFTSSNRSSASDDPLSSMTYERADSAPVLFPYYTDTIAFNTELLASASEYDQENPNLITKLIPQHYLLEGADQDGFFDIVEGNAGQAYSGTGIPGQGKMGNAQILVSLLYIWARFFDDIKVFIDSFSTLRTVDYDTGGVTAADTVPDNFLLNMVQSFGFHLPPLFNDSTLEQYVRGENIDLQDITTSELNLRQVQNQLLRRVLVNLPDVLKSKGTQHSIQSFLRAVGIDPNNSVRIREFGGPTTRALSFARETKIEPGAMVEFPVGYATSSLTTYITGAYAVSPFLSASRIEPGFPLPQGQFVQQSLHPPHGISNNRNDGLLTSGSWSWEGIVKFTPASNKFFKESTQSLVRLCVATGSTIPNHSTPTSISHDNIGLIANLIAVSSSIDPRLTLYIRPGDSPTSPLLKLDLRTTIPGYTDSTDSPPGIFNYDKWNVSFGCKRSDDGLGSAVSSSYFLRLAYQNNGQIEFLETTSSFFQENPGVGTNNVLRTLNSTTNASGTFLAIGTGQFIPTGSSTNYLFLNNTSVSSGVPDEARTTFFNGRMSNFRFWSRALEENEWREHVRNYNSVGVEDPLSNWNYVHTRTGSFGGLRLNTFIDQEVRQAISTASLTLSGPADNPTGPIGDMVFVDYSENGFHLTGSGFPINKDIVVGEIFDLSYLSPYFDEASSNEKVRARSFQDYNLVSQTPWAQMAPVYEIVASEQPTDDVRFIIEFSLVDALNRDIVTMFATFDAMDNALGSPELIFSPDYPDLSRMRDVYFNRIKDKLNFQAFFEFFRWFDSSIGTFIQQLIPRKTRFKGTNFTVESHMLERAKQEYLSSEIYLGESIRQNLDSVILLQQIQGTVRKY